MTAPIPDEFLELIAEKLRSLADPTRLWIIRPRIGFVFWLNSALTCPK